MKAASTLRVILLTAIISAPCVASGAEVETYGDGQTYTLTTLINEFPTLFTPSREGYTLNKSLVIAQGDKLMLGGTADSPLHFTADAEAGITVYCAGQSAFANVHFENIGMRYAAGFPLQMNGCRFSGAVSGAAVQLTAQVDGNTIDDCSFISTSGPAVTIPANYNCGLTFTNNTLRDCNTANTNQPMLNLTVPGPYTMTIAGNTIQGAERTMVGGLAIANLLDMDGANQVQVINNNISDCRYGIALYVTLDAVVSGNVCTNNRFETNPNNGGSALNVYDPLGKQVAMISGNTFRGSLWGVTVIGGKDINLGRVDVDENDPAYNVGHNRIYDNGFDDTVYNLYNNSQLHIYAQNNYWGTDNAAEAAAGIWDADDLPELGAVNYMPMWDGAASIAGVETATPAEGPSRWFTLSGHALQGEPLQPGIYVRVDASGRAAKVAVGR